MQVCDIHIFSPDLHRTLAGTQGLISPGCSMWKKHPIVLWDDSLDPNIKETCRLGKTFPGPQWRRVLHRSGKGKKMLLLTHVSLLRLNVALESLLDQPLFHVLTLILSLPFSTTLIFGIYQNSPTFWPVIRINTNPGPQGVRIPKRWWPRHLQVTPGPKDSRMSMWGIEWGEGWRISACALGPANIAPERLTDSQVRAAPDDDTLQGPPRMAVQRSASSSQRAVLDLSHYYTPRKYGSTGTELCCCLVSQMRARTEHSSERGVLCLCMCLGLGSSKLRIFNLPKDTQLLGPFCFCHS